MNLANSKALFVFLLVMGLIIGHFFYSKHLQSRLAKWISPALWPVAIPDFSISKFKQRFIFSSLALVFLSIAIARPQWGQREEQIETRGIDVLFLLDLSNSMLAEDTPPSRLARAQSFIRSVLQNLGDDRAGVVSFAGKAFLTVPLTNDFDYVLELTDTLTPSSVASQGTQIGDAIDVAIRAFERGSEDPHKQSRVVVLISDGEDFGENAITAATRLKDFGSGFFTVSVGTAEGAPIPIRSDSGVLQTYKKDPSQKTVLSKVNRPLLAKIAAAGGGSHFELVNPEDAAYNVTKAIRNLGHNEAQSRLEIIRIDRFQIFLGISILFFFLSFSIGYRKRHWRFWILPLVFLSLNAQAQSLESYLSSKKGERLYQAKKYDDSAKAFESAKKDGRDTPILSFNQGTALARDQKSEEAVAQFEDATKRSLLSGDFETAAKSLYNEGLIHSEQKNMKESYDRLTKAIELAKRSGQTDLEAKARKALAQAFEQQKKDASSQKDASGQKDQKGQKGQKDQNQDTGNSNASKSQMPSPEENGKKRQFKGSTLSKDVAESIMNDLSDREKQLYQRRLGDRKPKEVPNDKDW